MSACLGWQYVGHCQHCSVDQLTACWRRVSGWGCRKRALLSHCPIHAAYSRFESLVGKVRSLFSRGRIMCSGRTGLTVQSVDCVESAVERVCLMSRPGWLSCASGGTHLHLGYSSYTDPHIQPRSHHIISRPTLRECKHQEPTWPQIFTYKRKHW